MTRLQCCIAIREQHKNKIRLNAHDRRQSLRLQSGSWQACVIYRDGMIYLASLGAEEASWEVSNSFLHHFYSHQSKPQRAGAKCERSINGLLMLPSYISCLCYFKPCLRFTFWASAFLLCLLPHALGSGSGGPAAMGPGWIYGKQKPYSSVHPATRSFKLLVCFEFWQHATRLHFNSMFQLLDWSNNPKTMILGSVKCVMCIFQEIATTH